MSDPAPEHPRPGLEPTTPNPAAARRLGEALSSRGSEIDALRRLPDDVVAALVDAGVFRMFVPARYHGHQQAPDVALAVIEELAYWNASVAWCAMIGATTGLTAASLPDEHARMIYRDDPRLVTAAVAEPRGRARRVEGGLLVDGRWSWGSGAHHCAWIGGGCRIEPNGGDGGGSAVALVFFERAQVTLHDTWHATGLRGTGSGDFEVSEAFVPAGRWIEGLVAPRAECDLPLYRFPFFGLLALGVAAVGLGLARRALVELRELAGVKRYVGSRRTLAERPAVQAAVGEAQARLAAARGLVAGAVAAAWAEAEDGTLTVDARRRLRGASTFAMRSAVAVVDAMHEHAGGSAVFESSPLERAFRDVHVAASHGMVASRTYELCGRLALGLDTDTSQL